jgi:hypothetical protein
MEQLEHRLSLISLDLFKQEDGRSDDEDGEKSESSEDLSRFNLIKMNDYLDSLLEELNLILGQLRQQNRTSTP